MQFHLVVCPTMSFADSRFKEATRVLGKYGIEESSRGRRYIKTDTDEFQFTNNDEKNRRGVRPEAIKSMEWFDGYIYAMEHLAELQPEE